MRQPVDVLLVNRYFWPENVAEEPFMLRQVAKYHLDKGDRVTVVCGLSKYESEVYAAEFGSSSFRIINFLSKPDRDLSSIWRLINSLKLVICLIKALRSRDYELINIYSYPPFFNGLIAWFSRYYCKNAKIVANMQDLLGYLFRNKLLGFLYRKCNKILYLKSDVIVVLSESMKTELLRVNPEFAHKVFVNQNFPSGIEAVSRSCVDHVFDYIYAGNIGKPQRLDRLIIWLSKYEFEKRPRIVICGSGTEKKKVEDLARKLSVDALFTGNLDREQLREYLNRSKIGVVSCDNNLFSYAFPSKLAHYLMNGLPVLVTTNDPAISSFLESNSFGFSIDVDSKYFCSESIPNLQKLNLELDHEKVLNEFSATSHFKKYERYTER